MRTKYWFLSAAMLFLFGLSAAVPAHAAPSRATASDLRTLLDLQLSEHVYLAAAATGAALGGRDAEFQAAAAALDANSVDISKSIGSVYGADAEAAFLPLWRSHINFFVDYTQGKAANDQAKQDKAVADLTAYTEDFAAFVSGANPNLPRQTVADLLVEHVLSLKDVVDAQAADDLTKAYTELREAFHHMQMIADPLANAIAQQFPDRFGENMGTPGTMVMPNTGIETQINLWAVAMAVALIVAGSFLIARGRRAAR
jgi:LPXTG-motif cell wall-anchored protein